MPDRLVVAAGLAGIVRQLDRRDDSGTFVVAHSQVSELDYDVQGWPADIVSQVCTDASSGLDAVAAVPPGR